MEIHAGDLVFADPDGIAVVPKKLEARLLERAFETMRKEKNIVWNILLGRDSEELVSRFGEF